MAKATHRPSLTFLAAELEGKFPSSFPAAQWADSAIPKFRQRKGSYLDYSNVVVTNAILTNLFPYLKENPPRWLTISNRGFALEPKYRAYIFDLASKTVGGDTWLGRALGYSLNYGYRVRRLRSGEVLLSNSKLRTLSRITNVPLSDILAHVERTGSAISNSEK